MTEIIDHIAWESFHKNAHYYNPEEECYMAIGDVHGCLDELETLVDSCIIHANQKDKIPVIYLMGDLIDRGPYFLEVFEYVCGLMDYGLVRGCLIGNHEYKLWLEMLGVIECRSQARRVNHDKMAQMSANVRDFVLNFISKKMSNFILLGDDILLSHAPMADIERLQSIEKKHASYPASECCMRSNPVDYSQVTSAYHNIHGHQHWDFRPIETQLIRQKDNEKKIINVDLGCVYGDGLLAFDIASQCSITTLSRKVYFDKTN